MPVRSVQPLRFTALRRLLLASAVAALTLSGAPARAEYPVTTMATVIDRTQIEDMLYDYYAHIDSADVDFGSYYLEDGLLDVNGQVARGPTQIKDLYRRTYVSEPTKPGGKYHVLLSNPRIIVHGNLATADFIWTIIDCDAPKAKPRLSEQGREHDEFVKRGVRWYLKSRVITSDAGLAGIFVESYKER
jgi:SnoaL-like domain